MKRSIVLLLAFAMILGMLTLAACGNSDSKAAQDFTFKTVGDLKKSGDEYAFLKSNGSLEDDLLVCVIPDSASGEVTVPAKNDNKTVVAVISESASNDKVTSIKLEAGVKFMENVFTDSSAVASLELPKGFKEIYKSFNKSALTEVSFPSTVQYIVDSFCECEKLAKAETAGYIYGITNAFLKDAALADFTVGGSIQKITDSFNESGVTAVSFKDNIHDIVGSFNDCPALKSVSSEQIAGDFKKSFNNDAALTDLTYKQGGGSIFKCFCDNAVRENVDFGSGVGNISESFENCAKYTLPETPEE